MSGETPLPPTDGLQTALLQWAIKNTVTDDSKEPAADSRTEGAEEAPKPKFRTPKEIAPEWYEAIFGKSDVERMREIMKALTEEKELSDDSIAEALENLHFIVELTHNANDFAKIGGLPLLHNLLQHTSVKVRNQALWIVAICSSNNPEFQGKFLKHEKGGSFDLVLKSLKVEEDVSARLKALHAVSALINNCELGLFLFFKADGISLVEKLLDLKDTKVDRKVAFFVRALVFADSTSKLGIGKKLCASSIPAALINLMKEKDTDIRENCAESLAALCKYPEAVTLLRSLDAERLLVQVQEEEDLEMKYNEEYNPIEMMDNVRSILRTVTIK